jgi:NAD(P)-dependent dehydrogenase (short-subunit alcohol dehydrogenase family)
MMMLATMASAASAPAAAAPRGAAGGTGTAKAQASRRILVTGSSTGLGMLAARLLVAQGHRVVVHGRSSARAAEAMKEVPGAEAALHGDFASLRQVRAFAEQANASGRFDAVIHNAAVGYQEQRIVTEDGLPHVFAINTLAPYVLTALIARPQRLVYMSSGMHRGVDGRASLDDLTWERRSWQGSSAYAESKLHDMMLAFAVARRWKDVLSNSVDPGWVPTRMGGRGAPDDLEEGATTQAWLAVSDDKAATVSGRHFHHKARRDSNPDASKPDLQDRLIAACEKLSGVALPG